MFTLVIQAGGESRRMGQDKALAPFLGQPLIQRVLERVTHLPDEVLVTTNRPDDFRFLSIRLVSDQMPGYGALGGLYTALSAASHPLVGVIACDMPFVNASLLAAQRDRLAESGNDAVVPQGKSGLEPFHAVYRRTACLPLIQSALEAGKRRVDSWFAQARITFISPEEVQIHDPQQMAFYNINTLEELLLAEQIAQESPWL